MISINVKRTFWIMCIVVMLVALLASYACAANGRLNLSDEQDRKFRALGSEMFGKMEKLRGELGAARMDLAKVYMKCNLDEKQARALIGRIGKIQKQLLDSQLELFIKTRRILTNEQFAELLKQISERMGGMETLIALPREDVAYDPRLHPRMRDMLHLTPEQLKRAEPLMHRNPKKVAALENIYRASKQLAQIYSSVKLDESAARKQIKSLHASQVELTNISHGKQKLIRSVLTSEQFSQFQAEVARRLKERSSPGCPK